LLAELPARLRIELTVVNHRPMIERFPLFQQAEPGAVAMLALLIQQQTHAPGENIIFEGERNNSLYFVRSGELRVFVRSTNAPKRQAGGPNLQESFFSVARRESSRVRPLSASSSASQHRQSDSQENAACQESASESAGALGRIRQCTSAWDRIGVVRTADPAANAPDRELGPKDTTQASSSPAGSRLTRQGSATMLLRDAVKRVVAVNAVIEREKNAKEEASRKRIQEIKDASVQDIALLGNAVATLGDGDAFGEQSFLSHVAAMSTVRCIRYSDLVALTHDDLAMVFESYPALEESIVDFASGKLAKYTEQNERVANAVKKRRRGSGTAVKNLRRASVLLSSIRPGISVTEREAGRNSSAGGMSALPPLGTSGHRAPRKAFVDGKMPSCASRLLRLPKRPGASSPVHQRRPEQPGPRRSPSATRLTNSNTTEVDA